MSARDRFGNRFPGLHIERDELVECLLFLVSGGVGGEAPTVRLSEPLLRAVHNLDRALVAVMPGMFALARRLVIVLDHLVELLLGH